MICSWPNLASHYFCLQVESRGIGGTAAAADLCSIDAHHAGQQANTNSCNCIVLVLDLSYVYTWEHDFFNFLPNSEQKKMAILKSLCQSMPIWTPTTPNASYCILRDIDLRFSILPTPMKSDHLIFLLVSFQFFVRQTN